MTFATVEDLAAALGQTLDLEDLRAIEILEAATEEIKSYCGQSLEAVAEDVDDVPGFGETVLLDGGTDRLVLPEFPVTAVGEVVEDGVTLTEGGSEDYVWERAGILTRMGCVWTPGFRTVEVSYDRGYDPIPADLRGVCVSAAARAYQEQLAGQSTDYQQRVGVALSEDERRTLDRKYRDIRAR